MDQLITWIDKHPDMMGIFMFVLIIFNLLRTTIKSARESNHNRKILKKFETDEPSGVWGEDEDPYTHVEDIWDIEHLKIKDKELFKKQVEPKKKERKW